MLSIVVPVLNEEQSLDELHAQIAATCSEHGIEWESVSYTHLRAHET